MKTYGRPVKLAFYKKYLHIRVCIITTVNGQIVLGVIERESYVPTDFPDFSFWNKIMKQVKYIKTGKQSFTYVHMFCD